MVSRGPEETLKSQVLHLAGLYGWLIHHDRPAKTEKGWRTAVEGDAGFPDLVLLHPVSCRLIVAELKSDTGRLTLAQQAWVHAWRQIERVDPVNILVAVWRPDDWDAIHRAITVGARP